MSLQSFEQLKILLFFLLYFHYEFYAIASVTLNQGFELSLFVFGDDGLLAGDFVDQLVDISSR